MKINIKIIVIKKNSSAFFFSDCICCLNFNQHENELLFVSKSLNQARMHILHSYRGRLVEIELDNKCIV